MSNVRKEWYNSVDQVMLMVKADSFSVVMEEGFKSFPRG